MITYQRFMVGACLRKDSFFRHIAAEHDHCTMCGAKFSMDGRDLQEGYVTLDRKHWVCFECMREYKDEYGWSVEP